MTLKVRDYECLKCGEVFEVVSRDGEDVECPKCGAPEPKVLPSAAAGYRIYGANDASVSPRSHGAFRRKK